MSEIQKEDEPNNNFEILKANNLKYKKELSRLDVLIERLEFENTMIYDKLQREMRTRTGDNQKLKMKTGLVERERDVDLNFNTKVNYVEFLQRKIAGSPNTRIEGFLSYVETQRTRHQK